ncbi:MAG TPA: diguanylate cyclase [Fimbriimonas sp.]
MVQSGNRAKSSIRNGRNAFWACSLLLLGICLTGREVVGRVRHYALETNDAWREMAGLMSVRTDLDRASARISAGRYLLEAKVDLERAESTYAELRSPAARSVAEVLQRRKHRLNDAFRLVEAGNPRAASRLLRSRQSMEEEAEMHGVIAMAVSQQERSIGLIQEDENTGVLRLDLLFLATLTGSVILAWAAFVVDERSIRRNLREKTTRERQRVVAKLAESTNALVYLYDLKGQSNVYISPAITHLLGWPRSQIESFGSTVLDRLLHPDDVFDSGKHPHGQDPPVRDFRLLHADGSYRWFSAQETVFESDAKGNPLTILGSAVDISEKKKQERMLTEALEETLRINRALSWEANTDALTALHNKKSFMSSLEVEFETHRASERPLSMILFDLDDFKDINDRYGHPAGDDALKEVGRMLRSSTQPEQCAARYGGEEFAVLCPNMPLDQARALAEKIRRALEQEVFGEFRLSASFGVAETAREMAAPEELIARADLNLYHAKSLGKNRVCDDSGTVLSRNAVE